MAEYLSITANIRFVQGKVSEMVLIERINTFLDALELEPEELTQFHIHKQINESDVYNLSIMKNHIVDRPIGLSFNIMQRNPICDTNLVVYEIKDLIKRLGINDKVTICDYSFMIENQTDEINPRAIILPKDKEDYKLRYIS